MEQISEVMSFVMINFAIAGMEQRSEIVSLAIFYKNTKLRPVSDDHPTRNGMNSFSTEAETGPEI